MALFYANPYNWSLTGFSFSTLEQYQNRLSAAIQTQNDVDFEHEIDPLNLSEVESAIFKGVGSDIRKFFDVIDEYHDTDIKVLSIAAYLVENEFEKEFIEAIDYAAGFDVFENREEFEIEMEERLLSEMNLPKQHPLVMYFDAESYCDDLILNSDYMELDGFICTDPNAYNK